MTRRNYFLGIAAGIFGLVFLCAFGLFLLHTFDFLYRFDIKYLDIPTASGYSQEVILRNYHSMMAYLSPFSNQPFTLPDLAFTKVGQIHFAEVKEIFKVIYLLGLAAFLMFMILWFRVKNKSYLLISAMTTVALPLGLFTVMALDFNKAFTVFHKIFFPNGNWVFDYDTDHIINILPEPFFLHCAVFIAAIWVLGAIIQYLLYRKYIFK